MTVRPAAKEDIPAIAAMEAATFPSGASESFLASLIGGAGAVLAAAKKIAASSKSSLSIAAVLTDTGERYLSTEGLF